MYVAILLFSLTGQTQPLVITPGESPTRVTVAAELSAAQAARLPKGKLSAREGQAVLRFVLLQEDGVAGPPIFGTYQRIGQKLQFTPRFALSPGAGYRAELRDENELVAEKLYTVPELAPSTPAQLTRIYPTADLLPANLLKFYLYFDRPMREGREIFDRLHLEDEQGQRVHDPWRRVELWSDDARRLTLWIHPGRIKQGVNLREEFGPVLRPDKRYTLVIDPTVQDAAGRLLGKPFRKPFRTTEPVHAVVNLQEWQLQPPGPGDSQPLEVRVPRPLDHALVKSQLHVVDSSGQPVAGDWQLDRGETQLRFTPARDWASGEYRLRATSFLEDLAGNTPQRVFDTDLSQTAERGALQVRFAVGTPSD